MVVVVVVVVGDGVGVAPPLLLFDRARTPNAITTPAPTNQSNGGVLSLPWACFTPAAPPGANGPVSADIAGSGAITIAALTHKEINVLFTLSSLFGNFVAKIYHSQG